MKRTWWEKAIIYQIYPKSFKDSNSDGIGDLNGIINSLDYIKNLGCNTIWLNPIFISPQIDNGYDVSNYYAIDDIFGDLSDVENLINEAHKRDIRVILDLVLNHTSSEHPWFQEALKGPENIYRDYYLWSENNKDGMAPNNWASFFGGSVWEKESENGQYYFHLFDKEMPDLNWRNPEVKHAMVDIAKFWLEKGIDGFRLDAFIHIIKDDFSKEVPNVLPNDIALAEEYYANLPEVKRYLSEFISEIKSIKSDCFILGEAASATPELSSSYIRDDLCSTVVSFNQFAEIIIEENKLIPKGLEKKKIDPVLMKENLKNWQEKLSSHKFPTLYWNNHDMTRVVSRFGDENELRDKSAKALATAMYLLRGIPIILYGEEIGMKNLEIKNINTFQDPNAKEHLKILLENRLTKEEALKIITASNKEASRGVMQWDNSEFVGFSDQLSWIGENRESIFNVVEESNDNNSILNYYRKLLKLKNTDLFSYGTVEFLNSSDEVLAYKRSFRDMKAVVIVNITSEFTEVPEWFNDFSKWEEVLVSDDNYHQKTMSPYSYKVLKNNKKVD